MFAGLLTKIAGFAGKYMSFLLLGALIVTAVLWLLERRTNAGLVERNGVVIAANAGQARVINELEAERARLESALMLREVEYAQTRDELARARKELATAAKTDAQLADWLEAPLPAYVRGLLY